MMKEDLITKMKYGFKAMIIIPLGVLFGIAPLCISIILGSMGVLSVGFAGSLLIFLITYVWAFVIAIPIILHYVPSWLAGCE
jgi:ABC-type transport system involved in Fe-S cluster assembly fused permease/ATPase subunit